MKTYVLGLILIGLTNLSFSQNDLVYTDVNTKTHVNAKSSTNNASFINSFSMEQIPSRIKNFQKYVAEYKISEASVFRPSQEHTYNVVFKEDNNSITNLYDADGIILKSEQTFTEVRLPYHLSTTLAKTHPNWSIVAVQCNILYTKNEEPVITYKVKLEQGMNSKAVKLMN